MAQKKFKTAYGAARTTTREMIERLRPSLLEQADFIANQVNPAMQQGWMSVLPFLTGQGLAQQADRFRTRAANQAHGQGMRQASQMGYQGLGSGVQAGAMMDAQNRAMEAANDYSANLYSPEAAMQRYGQMMQLGQGLQGMGMPMLEGLAQLANMLPKESRGRGGGLLGQLLNGAVGSIGASLGAGMNPFGALAGLGAKSTASPKAWPLTGMGVEKIGPTTYINGMPNRSDAFPDW